MRISSAEFTNYLDSYNKQGLKETPLGRLFCEDYNISDQDLYFEADNSKVIQTIQSRYVGDIIPWK